MASAAKTRAGRFGRYAVLGLMTNGSIYLIFLLMVWAGVAPILASGLCYVIGVTASYVFNRSWTFSSTSTHFKDIVRFAAAYGVGFAVTLTSMYFLVDPLGPALAQLLTIGITAVSIFTVLELLQFGR